MNIKQHFIQGLMPRLDALNASREHLKTNKEEAEKSIRRIAHILRGSGGTFGFQDVTDMAGKVEDATSENMLQALSGLIRLLTTLITEQDVIHIQNPTQIHSKDELPVHFLLPANLDESSYILKMIAKDSKGRQATKTISTIIVDYQWRDEMNEALDTSSTVFNNGKTQRIEVNFTSPGFPLEISFKLYNSAKHRQLPILLVEDTPEDALIAKSVLNQANYEVIHTETAEEAKKIMAQKQISMVILDLMLDDFDGRDFLIQLKSNQVTENIPAIILSSKTDTQTKTECLALGANAYFEKPLDPDLLLATISAHLNMSQKHQMESRYDTLTELPNRVAFKEEYSRTLASMERRTMKVFSVGMVDFDYFKRVNDKYGHEIGDKVLYYVSNFIKTNLRKSDVTARWGGEEFAILFPNTDAKGAKQALDKVRAQLKKQPFSMSSEITIPINISGGIIAVTESTPMEAAISRADNYLYKAKETGRDMVLTESDKIVQAVKEIVLVDDDDITAEFVQHRLEKEGYNVQRFNNGQDAYNALKELTPSLIITDVKMPGMDGFELLNRLRNTPGLIETPIIMLTSIGKEKDIARGLNSGANDYIIKPFSATELLARIDRLLRKHENINY
ncbi:MAG: response regulator [Candidatus Marinimicrobia bacterium]|nr:response regulator [Candidatus Neomarinimicrobiota bacterium]